MRRGAMDGPAIVAAEVYNANVTSVDDLISWRRFNPYRKAEEPTQVKLPPGRTGDLLRAIVGR